MTLMMARIGDFTPLTAIALVLPACLIYLIVHPNKYEERTIAKEKGTAANA